MNLDKAKRLAIAASAGSDHHTFKLGAVIFRGKELLTTGFNWLAKTHPEYSLGEHFLRPLHAEASAILSIRNKVDLTGASLFVYRQGADGNPAMAKPCKCCMNLIRKYGIKEIIYSEPIQGFVTEKV